MSRKLQAGLAVMLIIALSLVIQRDGVNLVKYHSIEPDCSKVLSVDDCRSYSPWYYNYVNHSYVVKGSQSAGDNIFKYTEQWFYWMWYRLFFAVNGLTSNFANNPPLPLPSIAGAALALIGCLAILKIRRRLFALSPYLLFLVLASFIYAATLYWQGYSSYHYTAILENMNGRYLIPILLPIAAIAGVAISQLLKRARPAKTLLAIVITLMFLQGGGVLTFMLRSDNAWYWHNTTVEKVNHTANKVAKQVVIRTRDRSTNYL